VKDHQSKIEKVAEVSDSGFLRIMPSLASHFVKAEVEYFNYDEKTKLSNGLSAADGSVAKAPADVPGDQRAVVRALVALRDVLLHRW
jgi:hypothetical protein